MPLISAPSRSAEYSRVRLIVIWIRSAASGAKSTASSTPIGPIGLSRSRPPPKKKPNCASIEIAPATVAATVIVRVSRFLIWASSCAITPSSSSRSSACMMPVVTATAAFSGLRPVAKAFGWSCRMMKTLGIGMPARCASRPTISWSSGALARVTGSAWCMRSASLSEFQ